MLWHGAEEALENREGEPRWPAAISICAVSSLSFALPHELVAYPKWIPLVVVSFLTMLAWRTHHKGKHDWNNIFGFTTSTFTTLFLLWSVGLLVVNLKLPKETPGALLRSAAALWVTNVVVFALWYWRLDAGGPNQRDKRNRHACGAFLFPQMTMNEETAQCSGADNWSPNFWDYLFLAFNTSTALSPTDTAVLSRWAKLLMMAQAAISLVIIALLAARAINTLPSL